MATGTVKWFNNAKGYGFILPEGSGDDLFIHYSSIQMDGYKSLKAGQVIDYDIQAGPKGMHAVNIRATSSSESAIDEGVTAESTGAAQAQVAQPQQREVEVEES